MIEENLRNDCRAIQDAAMNGENVRTENGQELCGATVAEGRLIGFAFSTGKYAGGWETVRTVDLTDKTVETWQKIEVLHRPNAESVETANAPETVDETNEAVAETATAPESAPKVIG